MALSKRKRSKRNQSKTEINLLCLNWSDWQESILGDMKKLCLTNNSETKARYVKQVYTIVQNVRQKVNSLELDDSDRNMMLISSNLRHFLSQITNTATLDYLPDPEFKQYMGFLLEKSSHQQQLFPNDYLSF